MGGTWVRGGGADAAGLPYHIYSRRVCWGEGGGRGEREQTRPCTRCSLHECSFTLCLSFSYLRSAVEASFDTRKACGKPYTIYDITVHKLVTTVAQKIICIRIILSFCEMTCHHFCITIVAKPIFSHSPNSHNTFFIFKLQICALQFMYALKCTYNFCRLTCS